MYKTTYKLITVNVFILAMFCVAFAYGIMQPIYVNDVSTLSYYITGIMLITMILAIWNSYQKDKYKPIYNTEIDRYLSFISGRGTFLFIGISGTLIGLSSIMDALSISSTGNVSDQVGHLLEIMKHAGKTCFNCTLLGIISKMWTDVMQYVTGDED